MAGIGAVSMMTGSLAARTAVWPLAIGVRKIYDYLLGGKQNFAADRAAAEQVMQVMPEILDTVRGNRQFLRRAVGFLREAGDPPVHRHRQRAPEQPERA